MMRETVQAKGNDVQKRKNKREDGERGEAKRKRIRTVEVKYKRC